MRHLANSVATASRRPNPACACRLASALATSLLLAACTSYGPALDDMAASRKLPRAVELMDTPFFAQEDYQCGPAALATALTYSGVATTPGELVERVYIPARRGSLQVELLAAARERGRIAYQIDPGLGALLAELAAGRPVLVLQDVGAGPMTAWHYAVVIGYEADAERLVLRSGKKQRLRLSAGKFARTWAASDNWGVVLLTPGELPVSPAQRRYLQAAAAMEKAGQVEAAMTAFTSATETWPDSVAALLGLANAQLAAGNNDDAVTTYLRAIAIEPDDPVLWNNLAQAQLALGRCDAAHHSITHAQQAVARQSRWRDTVSATRAEINEHCGLPAG